MSFAHGAQDGLKFIGIMSIYTNIINQTKFLENDAIIMLICALTMGLGVLIGGKKIVTTVGENIVKLENEKAFCTDISTIISLIMASLFGLPVSTTHVKTMAIVAAGGKERTLNHGKLKEISIAWGLTFPVCGLIAFIIIKIIV